MDLEKLEKLSALKLPESQHKEMYHSLSGVVDMLHAIDTIEITAKSNMFNEATVFENDEVNTEHLENKNNSLLNTHEGYFLAPKVITKD